MSKSVVPQGYKRTDAGIIPKDWDVSKFKEIAALRKERVDPRKAQSGLFCIELEHISQGDGRLLGFTETTQQSSLKSSFKKGDVLFGKLRAYLRKYLIAHQDGVCSTEIWAITPKEGRSLPAFIYQIVQTDDFIEAASLAYGTHMPRSDWNVVGNLPIAFPEINEQRVVAEALEDVDALISAQEQLITKKRDIKQATMQQLLTGRTRLPSFNKKWSKQTYGDILRVRHGKSQKGIEDVNGVYPILASGGLIGWANSYLYNKPSVLIGRKGTIDKPQFMDSPFWTVDTLFYTEILDTTFPKYIFYSFNRVDWRSYNEGSGVPSLNASTIEKIECILPDYEEQIAIASVLSDMDSEIAALESERDKTKALKQGMMQELLTGKTRLI